jgi:hypothetical protein
LKTIMLNPFTDTPIISSVLKSAFPVYQGTCGSSLPSGTTFVAFRHVASLPMAPIVAGGLILIPPVAYGPAVTLAALLSH